MSRRRVLGAAGATATGLVLGLGPYTERAWANVRFTENPFTLGVASGDPRSDSVVLWTRLAPEPLAGGGMPDRAVDVNWELATDSGFRTVVRRGTKRARPELAHSVHVVPGGLEPGRVYWYRFRAGGYISRVGRTKTMPAAGTLASRLTFAFASCQQYEHGYYTAYRHMADEDLDLVLQLGDYIYEYGRDEYRAPGGNVRHHRGAEVTTLTGYRNRHAQYRLDPDLRAAHSAFPWVVTWDDHEVENNYANLISAEAGQDPQAFAARRAAAYQAYYEHMPLRYTSVPQGPDMQMYRRVLYGDLARFYVLDTRQYRDDQAGRGLQPANPTQADPSRSITGGAQEQWLTSGLQSSDARWNVLAQQVFFSQRDLGTDPDDLYSMDAWDGYLGSQRRVLDAMTLTSNPVVLTGDVHSNWACEVKADFDDEASSTVATEFVTTSITSGGDGSDVRADTATILAENPHIKFFNSYRGYVRCTVTPDQWRTDYRVVPYVKQRGAPITTRASFVVTDGDPRLQQVVDTEVPAGRQFSTLTERDVFVPQRD